MELYYEVEGLRAGSQYEVRIAVRKQGGSGGMFRKIFGGGGAARSASSSTSGRHSPITSDHRSLKLDKLKPGNYVLEVQVEDAQGRTDRRAQPFQVVEEEAEKKER